jgi:hypothetical protein
VKSNCDGEKIIDIEIVTDLHVFGARVLAMSERGQELLADVEELGSEHFRNMLL